MAVDDLPRRGVWVSGVHQFIAPDGCKGFVHFRGATVQVCVAVAGVLHAGDPHLFHGDALRRRVPHHVPPGLRLDARALRLGDPPGVVGPVLHHLLDALAYLVLPFPVNDGLPHLGP